MASEMASVIVENAWSTPIVAKSNAWCCGVWADKSRDYIRQQIIKRKFRTKHKVRVSQLVVM
jgi:hypothetical protein